MKLPLVFRRYVGTPPAGGVALGDDAAPSNGANPAPTDNVLKVPLRYDLAGNRLLLTYLGPGGALPLPVTLYAFEDSTEAWYLFASSSLAPGAVTAVGLVGTQPPAANQVQPGKSLGATLVAIVVAESGGVDPDGEYVFAAGADFSMGSVVTQGI